MRSKACVLFENERFIAVEKASGVSMATRPGDPDAERRVLDALGAPDPSSLFLIHRLDVGTSGIVLLARDAEAHRAASRLFQERAVEKVYRAIVWGRPVPPQGTIDAPSRSIAATGARCSSLRRGKPPSPAM